MVRLRRKTLDICRTSVRLGTDAQRLGWHMLTKLSHTSIVTGLNISFDPAAPLLLCCCSIIYRHTVTGQTPSTREATESGSENFIRHNCMKRKRKKTAFSSIIDICLLAMHNAGARSYDSHVLNIMLWGSRGLALHAFTYGQCVKSRQKAERLTDEMGTCGRARELTTG